MGFLLYRCVGVKTLLRLLEWVASIGISTLGVKDIYLIDEDLSYDHI